MYREVRGKKGRADQGHRELVSMYREIKYQAKEASPGQISLTLKALATSKTCIRRLRL